MHCRTAVHALAAFCALGPGAGAAVAQALPTPDPVDAFVTAYMDDHRVPGVAVAIVEDGRLVKARGYGFANVEHSVPVTAETVFQAGSIPKQFTAAAVLLLVEEGRLSLDDSITRHVAEAPASWSGVTVRHLLGHTGGLPDYEERIDPRADNTEEELVRSIEDQPLLFEPGTEWSYSNAGFMVLGVLVSRLTGEHWSVFVRDRILRPLGMETAQLVSEVDVVPNRASGYRLEDGRLVNEPWVWPRLDTGDGAYYLSVLDLVKWDQALRAGAILSDASRRAMWEPTRLADGTAVGYGMGWDVAGPPASPHVGHGGAGQGFLSYILRFDERPVTVVVLTNLAQANPHVLASGVATVYAPELATPLPEPRPLSASAAREYSGSYLLPYGDTVRVEVERGELVVRMPWETLPFQFLGEDVFREVEPARFWIRRLLRFSRRDGEVVEAWMGPPGQLQVRLRRVR